jgi:hypothetical protein
MSEGNVYVVNWKKCDEECEVWLAKRPKIRSSGESIRDALDELSSAVCLNLGDGEAVFELDPPVEKQPISLVRLTYNASCGKAPGISLEDYAALFEDGICNLCCRGVGARTSVPFPMGRPYPGDLLHVNFHFFDSLLASDDFRKLLSPQERASINWRDVDARVPIRRKFYELLPKEAVIPQVGDSDEQQYGWRCPKCDYHSRAMNRTWPRKTCRRHSRGYSWLPGSRSSH